MSRFACSWAWLMGMVLIGGLTDPDAARSAEVAGPPVLYLHTEFLPYERPGQAPYSNRLVRELVRQAILIAAREEMGLVTRDESLQEDDPPQATVMHVMPMERGDQEGKWKLKLISAEEGTHWETSFEVSSKGLETLVELAATLEAKSRSEFPAGLREVGVVGSQRPPAAPVPPGAEVEALLGRPDVVAQFGAVRLAHAAIAAQGESAEWLAVLVRGYANLALLTRHSWNCAPEAFSARAWLYAQRLMRTTDASDVALWHRAYAWAWGGLLSQAAADLDEVDRRRNTPGRDLSADVEPPAWVGLTRAFMRFDRAESQRIAQDNPDLRPWEAVIRFVMAHFDAHEPQVRSAVREIAEISPSAYMVFAQWETSVGLTAESSAFGVHLGPPNFSRQVPLSLAQLPDLPAAVSTLIAAAPQPTAVAESVAAPPPASQDFSPLPMALATQLRQESVSAADGELSWSCLASLLEEEQFLLVLNYLSVMQRRSHLSPSEAAEPLLPLIKNHRYAAYLEGYRYDFQLRGRDVINAWKRIKVVDPRPNMYLMLYGLRVLRFAGDPARSDTLEQNADSAPTLHGIDEALAAGVGGGTLDAAYITESLLAMARAAAPHSSRSTHLAILDATDPSDEQLTQWESQLQDNPASWTDLALLHRKRGNLAGVVRCCEKSLALHPNRRAAQTLSDMYLEQGDLERSAATLLRTLAAVDDHVEQLALHGVLAELYGERGKWEQALPHALACGESGSPVGCFTASLVTEALAQWDESERWIRQLAETYGETYSAHWYFWCERTGRGDLDAAREHAKKYLAVRMQETSRTAVEEGAYQILRGSRRLALPALQRAWTLEPSLFHAFLVARQAQASGEEAVRRDVLAKVEQVIRQRKAGVTPSAETAATAATAELAVLALVTAPEITPDLLPSIEQILPTCDMQQRGDLAYVVGQELADRGHVDEALLYWRRSLANPGQNVIASTLAGWELAKRSITSRDDQAAWKDGEIWPRADAADEE